MNRTKHRAIAILVATCLAEVGLAADPGRVKRFDVMPTALVARGEPSLQSIDLVIESREPLDACTLKVWTGDRLWAEKPLGVCSRG